MARNSISIKVIALLIAFLVISSFFLASSDGEIVRTLGAPVITNEYALLERSSIDQVITDGYYLYILYGEHQGDVQVFSLDGDYLYSAYFYNHLNGAFRIAADDGVLYVRDYRHNIYILQDGQLLEYMEEADASELLNTYDFNIRSEDYIVKFGSVYKITGDSQMCIIKRPWYSAFYQGNFMFILSLCSALAIGLTSIKIKRS